MKIDALITAGGKGSRIREMGVEKPMIELLQRPIIDYVIDALQTAAHIGDIYVSVSPNTQLTKEHLREKEVIIIDTSGEEYCIDLNYAMNQMTTREVFICPADMPLLSPTGIDTVVEGYYQSGVHSYSVATPYSLLTSLGIKPTYSLPVENVQAVFCGVSVLDRLDMLSMKSLTEGYMLTENMDLILNVNTTNELKIAEEVLTSSKKLPSRN
ncbi:NTP transferase domain-containing protein [Candidatus Methanomassiliicoccus intestinalis]|mgnify:CR=1 FL=1|uniref:NTP transferase domain-containing protein n=1 Tax=Candidatus Methanomassiliicoccus intestinalis TaxID=1406512 RepID=UPI0037DC7230